MFFFFLKKYFFLFLAVLGLCCCARASSSVRTSRCGGFSCCGAQTPGLRGLVVVFHELRSTGSVVVVRGLSHLMDAESSQTRNLTSVPYISKQNLNHWTTGKPWPPFLPHCVLKTRDMTLLEIHFTSCSCCCCLLGPVRLFAIPWTTANQTSLFPSLFPGACSNSCPLSW